MKLKIIVPVTCLFIISATFYSCNKDDNGGSGGTDFDRKAMLENIGFNLIIPNYQSLQTAIDQMASSAQAFIQSPDIANLSILRNLFKDSYLKWQNVSMYAFAEAETVLLRSSLNSFPTNTITINGNISSGTYNLDAVSNINAIGLPAIDFLIYGQNKSDADILNDFTSGNNFEQRKQYLTDVITLVKVNTDKVVSSWLGNEGNYIQDFVNADGTDIGSSLGLMINAINLHVEKFTRDIKIGIPLGVRSLGIPVPANVEARYSQNSISLAVANLNAIKNLYLGDADNNGIGLYENLVDLGIMVDGGLLADKILDQINAAIKEVEEIPEPFEDTVANNSTPVTEAYDELQKLVIILKTDLPSALGVLITYQDNDGD